MDEFIRDIFFSFFCCQKPRNINPKYDINKIGYNKRNNIQCNTKYDIKSDTKYNIKCDTKCNTKCDTSNNLNISNNKSDDKIIEFLKKRIKSRTHNL